MRMSTNCNVPGAKHESGYVIYSLILVGARFAAPIQTMTRPELPIAPCMAHHSLHGTPFEAFISLSYFLYYSYDTEKYSLTVGRLF